jgi:hypothetical protein
VQLTSDEIDNIGNLLPLSFQTNSKLGNLSPAEKVEKLRSDLQKSIENIGYVKEFLAKYGTAAENWNGEAIERRAVSMGEKLYRVVFKLD